VGEWGEKKGREGAGRKNEQGSGEKKRRGGFYFLL